MAPTGVGPEDPELVARSVAGDRDAFAGIVSRYQTLVCSVAYSGIGEIGASEDIAQETFTTAWRQLSSLREPGRLRSWLCGIARNLVRERRRRLSREPAHAAEPLEAADETASTAPLPSEEALSREREAILWGAIARLPEAYREPLVLYYREHRSVSRVATALEVSEDVVRQRLSRGRRLLHEEVLAFVEGTLERTAPGPEFTAAVVLGLPALGAASIGSASAGVKGAATLALKVVIVLNAIVAPIVGILGAWSGYREAISTTRTRRERRAVQRQFATILIGSTLLMLAMVLLGFFAANGAALAGKANLVLALGFTCAAGLILAAWHDKRQVERIRAEEKGLHPAAHADEHRASTTAFEYRSKARLLGLHLVHVRFTTVPGEPRRPAVGWVAVGDRAIGGIVAVGGLALAPLALGGLALGVASMGGIAAGLVALGGLSVAGAAVGGVAMGVVAAGANAIGWTAADGAILAVAREFAHGAYAAARHANDAAAREFFARHPWTNTDQGTGQLLMSFCYLPILLLLLPRRWLARRAGTR